MTSKVSLPHWIPGERPIFAWYHGPEAEARDVGVVLCLPFGYEMLCAHRAFRHLADGLAAAGFPTLRFDYDGAGDSSGGDADVDRVNLWLRSIEAGIHDLEQRGVRRVALVGVRFGALLAAEYAKRHAVDSLVLVSPPATGRAYLRELRALQAMRLPQNARPAAVDGEEASGVWLSTETVSRLEKVSIIGDTKPARRVLVVARDDVAGQEAKLVDQLTRLGSSATLSRAPGYASMMQDDPVKSVVPHRLWDEVVNWLSIDSSPSLEPLTPQTEQTIARVRANDSSPAILEEIVNVHGMTGVLSSPLGPPRSNAPTILLLNVGANHHVGCNRVYVDFARRWAPLGFTVLRFDLIGIGDSPPHGNRRENAVYSDAFVEDARRAMDWLSETRNQKRFALAGICSGAYVSYYASLADERVDCVILVNPLTFHWREGDSLDVRMRDTIKSSHFYRRAALDIDTWLRATQGKVHVRKIAVTMAERAWARIRRWPDQLLGADTDVTAGFRALCSRGTKVVLVCGEDDGSRNVVEDHLGDDARRLIRNKNFRFSIVNDTDHTFSPVAGRHELTEQLTAYLLETPRNISSPLSSGLRSAFGR